MLPLGFLVVGAPLTPTVSAQEGMLPLGLPQDVDAAATLLYAEDRRELTDELVELTQSPDPATRARAVLAVGRVGLPSGAPRLLQLLRDQHADVRALSAFGLGIIELDLEPALADASRRRFVEQLVRALLDDAATVREQALWSLGRLADSFAMPAIEQLLRDSGTQPDSVVAAALNAWWRLPDAQPQPLASLTRSPNGAIRRAAATTLRRLNDPDAMPMLEPLLDDVDPSVRAAAIRGLHDAPDAVARRHLPRLLRDDEWRVTAAALQWVVARWRDEPDIASDVLTAVVGTSLNHDRHVQRLAFEALALAASDYSVPKDRLIHGLRSGDATSRFAAVEAIAGGPTDLVDDTLEEVLDAYGLDRPPAAPGPAAVPEALAEMPLEAAAVIRLLGRAEDDEHRVWIEIMADSGPVAARAEALRQLRRLDPPSAALRAARWLAEGHPVLQAVAAEVADDLMVAGGLPPREDEFDTWSDVLWSSQRELGALGALEPRLIVLDSLLSLDREILQLRRSALLPDADRFFRLWALRNLPAGRRLTADEIAAATGPQDTGMSAADYRALAAEVLALQAAPPIVSLATSRGDLDVELRADWAPLTVHRLLRWVDEGFFADLMFHRVVPDFVIQFGDPTAVGYGGVAGSVRSEETPIPFIAGTMGLALAGRDSGGSQVFVVHSPQPHLDGAYPVLGRVVAGGRVVDRVQAGDALSMHRRRR